MSQISLIPALKLEPESAAPIVSRRLFLHNEGTGLPQDCQPFGLQPLIPSYDVTAAPKRALSTETPPLLFVNA